MYEEYCHPVDIEYNKDFLYNSCLKIQNWPIYSNDRGKTFFSTHKDILFPINIEAYKIKNKLQTTTTFSFSYVPPGHETGWHSDFTRGCTLICPIDPNPHLIEFKNGDEEIPYWYSGPLLTNAKSYHNGKNPTPNPRFNLLFHIDMSYNDTLELINKNQFITTWKQDYNICQRYDSKMLETYFDTHNDIENCSILITDDYETATKNSNKFVIFIGQKLGNIPTITLNDADDADLCQAVKYILDSPCSINHLDLGAKNVKFI